MTSIARLSCRAVLFDLDGVLIDSTRSVSRQWVRWAKENKLNPQDVLRVAHGRRTIEVVQLLMPNLDAAAEAAKLEAREAADTDGVVVMPGALQFVSAIPAGRWCVVTSGTRALATARLKLGGLPIPEVLVTADDVVNGKPDPEPYLAGAERLGIKASQCVVIEDAAPGIESAHAAQMKAIALTGTYSAAQLARADLIISSLTQLQVAWNHNQDSLDITLAKSDSQPHSNARRSSS